MQKYILPLVAVSGLAIATLPEHSYAWTTVEKNTMRNACLEQTSRDPNFRQFIGRAEANNFCDCVVDTTTRQYSKRQLEANPNLLSDREAERIAGACLLRIAKNGWTPTARNTLRNMCTNEAPTNISRTQAQTFCACFVDAVVNRYTVLQVAKDDGRFQAELERSGIVNNCARRARISM